MMVHHGLIVEKSELPPAAPGRPPALGHQGTVKALSSAHSPRSLSMVGKPAPGRVAANASIGRQADLGLQERSRHRLHLVGGAPRT